MSKRFFAGFLLGLLSVLPFAGAESVVKIANGRVKEVFANEQELVLAFRHPATGKTEDLILKIDEGTGFKKGVHLQDFRPNEPVSVDYEEAAGGVLRAIQVRRVPLRGVPDDIRRPKI